MTSPLEAAQAELAEQLVPWPDDFMESLHLNTGLLFARQTSMALMKVAQAFFLGLDLPPDEPQPVVDEAINGITASIVGLTHALVALGVLPEDAEKALQAGEIAGG